MRSDLAAMSTTRTRVDNPRRLSSKSSTSNVEPNRWNVTPECEASLDDVEVSMKWFPFVEPAGSFVVLWDAGIALASLVVCEEELERELFISTSYVPGMEVTLSSRLKSLYNIYSKNIIESSLTIFDGMTKENTWIWAYMFSKMACTTVLEVGHICS
ncbi:hypothetical protein Tco_1355888 [Tanacetum coccineum]